MNLACDVNAEGSVSVSVEVNSSALTMRISPVDISDSQDWKWIYYPEHPAYFESEDFDEDYFGIQAAEFIAELKKYHPQFDADGVKL
jgi:outer membrane scaffolding protein for murein synthesis (MipA/OmpV family)